jgi:hypothetical protein
MDDADQSLSGMCFKAMETKHSTTYYYLVPNEENNTAALLCSPSRKIRLQFGSQQSFTHAAFKTGDGAITWSSHVMEV